MKLTSVILVTLLFSANVSADCRDNTLIDGVEIKKIVMAKAKKIGYHQIGVKISSENYYGESLACSEYAKCMPMNGMKLIILSNSDFCDSDTGKIKSYINLYNKSVNELLVETSDCSQKKLTRT